MFRFNKKSDGLPSLCIYLYLTVYFQQSINVSFNVSSTVY